MNLDAPSTPASVREHRIRAERRELWVDGHLVELGGRAFDLLLTLVEEQDRVVPKGELLRRVWAGVAVEENNLQVQVSTLRRLLGPGAIATVPGRGYRYLGGHAPSDRRPAAPVPAGDTGESLPAPLFGRETDLATLTGLLASQRLVSVVGPSGVGKTVLAQSLARRLGEGFSDGVFTVDLAPLTLAEQLAPAVAGSLQLTLGTGPLVDALVQRLGERRVLLVLDNCEHLLAAVAELARSLLRGAPELVLLATSQEPLKLRAERVYRLGPLPPGPAQQLFVARAQAADGAWLLSPSDAGTIAEICRQLDGVALAIELAAARLPLLGLPGLRERLGERLRLLSDRLPERPQRHRTLLAALDWSHGLLDATQRAVYRRLGVMSGSFGVEAAQQVAASGEVDAWEALEALGALVDKSLVASEGGSGTEPRFRMLETMRHHALERLAECAELADTRERHLVHFLARAESARAPLLGAHQGQWLARLDADRDNLLAAHAACDHATRGAERGLRLVTALARYWLGRGLLVQGQRALEVAAARSGAHEHPTLLAEAWLRAGWLAAYRGLDGESAELLARSVSLARRHGVLEVLAEALSWRGYAHIALRDRATARACIEEAYGLAVALATHRQTTNHLAELERLEGHLPRAAQLYAQAQAISRASGDRLATMVGCNNLAMVAVARGELAVAREHLLESLAICDELGSRRGRLVVMEVSAALAARRQAWLLSARFDGAAGQHTVQMGRRRDVVDAEFLAAWTESTRRQLGAEGYAQAQAVGAGLDYESAVAELQQWLQGVA